MESLDHLLIDEDVSTAGRWVQPDPDHPMRIKTRGFTDEYFDAQARMQRSAAKGFNGDTERLPNAMKREINAKCLLKHSLVDIENCVIGGKALSIDEFGDLIQTERGKKLLGLAFTAAGMAHEANTAEAKEAEGN